MAASIILGAVCASMSLNTTGNVGTNQERIELVQKDNQIIQEHENFDGKEFRDDHIIVTFNEKTSKYIKENDCFLNEIITENSTNLDFDNSDLIADLNKYNHELTYTIPLIKKGRQEVIEIVNYVRTLHNVSICEPDFISNPSYEPVDEFLYTQWSINDSFASIDAKSAWNITKGNKRVRVGVIDSGVYNHPDLENNLVEGYDFYNNNSITTDDISGHGTHVAGIIGACQNDFGISGIAPNITIVPLQTSNANGTHDTSTRVKAINYATSLWGTEKQISVLNHSIGTFGDGEQILNAVKSFPGVFVWSAGNKNKNVDDYTKINEYNIGNLISVGNVDSSLERYESLTDPSKGSNYGNNVNIYAPGTMINSTIPVNQNPSEPYAHKTGTSMAAPHVAATAALIYSKYPNLTREEVKSAILEGTKNIEIYGGGNKYNAKFLNVAYALNRARYFGVNKYAYLRIGITNKSGNAWSVKLINDNNESVHVCYNSKMCTGGDGEEFSGLKHIKEIDIPANDYRIVKITENVMAKYISAAITYTNGNMANRYISCVKGLSYNTSEGGKTDMVGNYYQVQRLNFPKCSNIPSALSLSVISRTGFFSYTYTIRIRNYNSYVVFASYNRKMCFAGDAEKFTVNDITDVTIPSNSYVDVNISSNGTAGYITSRIKYSRYGFDYSKVTYANGLSKNSIGVNRYSLLRYEMGGMYLDEA